MRIMWIAAALISLVGTVIVWGFVAGWAGRIVAYPDLELLRSGEWLSWIVGALLMYGPLFFTGWMLMKAFRDDDS
ncbi:conserved hypothetical protein [Sphingomonas sp. AX6]|nr:conserved hypothetical protein [Sphingomonas sp. AX6]